MEPQGLEYLGIVFDDRVGDIDQKQYEYDDDSNSESLEKIMYASKLVFYLAYLFGFSCYSKVVGIFFF